MESIIVHSPDKSRSIEDLEKEIDSLNIKLHSAAFKNQELEKEVQDKDIQQKEVFDKAIATIRAITACLEFSAGGTHKERDFAKHSIIKFANNAIWQLEQTRDNADYPF